MGHQNVIRGSSFSLEKLIGGTIVDIKRHRAQRPERPHSCLHTDEGEDDDDGDDDLQRLSLSAPVT